MQMWYGNHGVINTTLIVNLINFVPWPVGVKWYFMEKYGDEIKKNQICRCEVKKKCGSKIKMRENLIKQINEINFVEQK